MNTATTIEMTRSDLENLLHALDRGNPMDRPAPSTVEKLRRGLRRLVAASPPVVERGES